MRLGLIPAHAGKTARARISRSLVPAHPRSRGENRTASASSLPTLGSSPLTRGKHTHRWRSGVRTGLIPAHAGKTCAAGMVATWRWAHPRSRGENARLGATAQKRVGSSPLTRGKPCSGGASTGTWGLIPAHAGKTRRLGSEGAFLPAHPRSRGENRLYALTRSPHSGSSPLTRGKLRACLCRVSFLRLIPAHAGKTEYADASRPPGGAHPRSRGENPTDAAIHSSVRGSSPLTRGKHQVGVLDVSHSRLIPAHAGKTLPDLRFYCADRSDLGNP